MPKDSALEIIGDFEQVHALAKLKGAVAQKIEEEASKELQWLRDVMEAHPALQKLLCGIRDRLAVMPGNWTSLPVNRHGRKRLKTGYIAHLYAGKAEGYTFEAAMREPGPWWTTAPPQVGGGGAWATRSFGRRAKARYRR